MKLVDQWHDIENGLPEDWESIRLTLTTEQASDLPRAAQVLGPINAGKVGSTLVIRVQRAAGPQGAQTALHLFSRLDEERSWCLIVPSDVGIAAASEPQDSIERALDEASVASSWDTALAPLRARYFITGEINTPVADVPGKLQELERRFGPEGTVTHLDGLSVLSDDWHFNVRPSNTEPLLRLNLEARSQDLMARKRDEVLAVIRS